MKAKYNTKNKNLKKRCECPRRSWDRCEHPWFFNCKGERGSLGVAAKVEAQKKFADIKAAILNGTYVKARPVTTVLVDERPSQATVASYYLKQHVEVRLEPEASGRHGGIQAFLATVMLPGNIAFTDKPFRLITLEDAEMAVAAKRKRTTTTFTKNGKTWTRTTGGDVAANRMQAHLASLWSWAIHPKRAYAESSPFSHAGRVPEELKKPREHGRDRRLHPGEEESLLRFAPDHLRDCIVAALESGMRKGEILSLQWIHVRWMQNELAVQWQNTKTEQSRGIPISPVLREILVRRQKAHQADTPWRPIDYVFGNEIGARVVDIRTAWDTAVLKAHGVEQPRTRGGRMAPEHRAKLQEIDLHFHDLRHEAGSRKLEAGWPLHAVSRWLGHTKLTTTDTYLNATTRLLHDLNERTPLTLVKA